MNSIFETLWFFLPALLANMAPVLVARVPSFSTLGAPLDGGRTWRGKRLLGAHKTIQGLVAGVGMGLVVGLIQYEIVRFLKWPTLALFSYQEPWPVVLLGMWLGFAALFGDAVKSFLKRQLEIAPGNPWRPWDQIDFIIGAIFFAWWFVPLTLTHIFIALMSAGLLSFLFSALGVALKIKRSV